MGTKTTKKTKQLLEQLSQRGPHRVDTGSLGFTGIPGAVYVPRDGQSPAPVIGFAHDWTKGTRHYAETMKHLASWGFVVVAPAGSRSLVPNHQRFADELSAAIENVLFSTLGRGSVRADSRRIGLAGHGLGGGIAALLASQRTDIDGVAAIFPASTTPPAHEAVVRCDAPGLIISASGGTTAVDAANLQQAWHGSVVGRRLNKAIDTGFVEANPLLKGIGLADPDRRTQRLVRPLIAGFLLATVAGEKEYQVFASEETMPDTVTVTDDMLAEEEDDALAGAPPLLRIVKSITGG